MYPFWYQDFNLDWRIPVNGFDIYCHANCANSPVSHSPVHLTFQAPRPNVNLCVWKGQDNYSCPAVSLSVPLQSICSPLIALHVAIRRKMSRWWIWAVFNSSWGENYRSTLWGDIFKEIVYIFLILMSWSPWFVTLCLHSLSFRQILSSAICQSKTCDRNVKEKKKVQRRSRLFSPWQHLDSLSKHTWLTNDNLSTDMSENLVSQNAVSGEERSSGRRWEWQKKTGPIQPFAIPSASHRHVTKSNCHPPGDMHPAGISK